MKDKLSTESYKGVRDFYPEDMFIQDYIFGIMSSTAERFGYQKYDASILEPAELYRAKTGEEIVNEQTYTFTDRGDREVTLRPEMTPTVARMIARKQREIPLPIRWYSIPNLFRYEQPQKGRLREHYQLNVDIFGVPSIEADIEIIQTAHTIMTNFGAEQQDFSVYVNSRKIINTLYDVFDFEEEKRHKISKLIDKKEKIPKVDFEDMITDICGDTSKDFLKTISSTKNIIAKIGENNEQLREIIHIIETLSKLGITNVTFSPLLMRGFDYYTGVVFEVFDNSKENNRSLFGGGRYDDLLSIFGREKIPAFGFGMGDVTIRDFLSTHNLLPTYKPQTDVMICIADDTPFESISKITSDLRASGINVAIDFSRKKIADQIKRAEKKFIPYIICIGKNEIDSNNFTLKELATRKTTLGDVFDLAKVISDKKELTQKLSN